MAKLFKINDEEFNVGVINIVRTPSMYRTSVGTTLDGTKHYKTSGVYFDYEITINTRVVNVEEYDRLYEILTAPVESYSVTLPYGQGYKTFAAIISAGNDSVIQNFSTFRRWGSLKIKVEALKPERMA